MQEKLENPLVKLTNYIVFSKVTNLQSTFTSRCLELLASNSRHYPASIFPKDTGNNVMKDNIV